MKTGFRTIFDKFFTVITGFAVLSLVVVLFVILGPMFKRGLGAVFFKGTVEFRRMQLAEFGHGDAKKVRAEVNRAEKVRANVYELIDKFKSGVDTGQLTDRAKDIYRNFTDELRLKNLPREQYTTLRSLGREMTNVSKGRPRKTFFNWRGNIGKRRPQQIWIKGMNTHMSLPSWSRL
jgi:hypothetical protein